MAKILIKRVGFWAGLAKLASAVVLFLLGQEEAAIATGIGGISSVIHSGESKPKDNGTETKQ